MTIIRISTAIALLSASLVSHADYSTSGTAGAVEVKASAKVNFFYTAATDGSSSTSYQAISPSIDGDWTFDFSDPSKVAFTGNIHLGNYETQTNVTGFAVIDGHFVFTNGNHAISGIGSYDEASNTFTFSLPSKGPNSNNGSVFSSDSVSCKNGKTSFFAKICKTWKGTTGHWEGVAIKLKFSKDRRNFEGLVVATEQSGKGITANTTTLNYSITGSNSSGKNLTSLNTPKI